MAQKTDESAAAQRIRIATEQLESWVPGSTGLASQSTIAPSGGSPVTTAQGSAAARASTFDQQAMQGLKVWPHAGLLPDGARAYSGTQGLGFLACPDALCEALWQR